MKMITKVFLVIAILLICLIAWALFLGDGGILEKGWNGVAKQVNQTWKAITGLTTDVMPEWKSDTDNVGSGITDMDTAGTTTTTTTGG